MRLDTIKSRLSCNIHSVYDGHEHSMYEIFSQFYKTVNELIENNNSLASVYEYLTGAGLEKEVAKELIKWLEDGTLADVINEDVFKILNDKLAKHHIANPIFYKTLRSKNTSVMQSFIYLENKNFIFSQLAGTEDGIENFVITKCDENGDFLSSMTIKKGGHGIITGYENNCGDIVIFYTDPQGNLRKTKFMGGITVNNEDMELLPKYNNEYQLLSVNKKANLITVINRNNQNKYYCGYVYKLDEYLSGKAVPIHKVNNIIASNQTLQGFGTDGKFVYAYTGLPHEQLYIRKHDLISCTYEDIAVDSNVDGITEAEGLYLNGDDFFIGICKGEPGVLRSNDIYSVTSLEQFIHNVANTINNVQTYKLCEGDGGAKTIELPTLISDIKAPGMYYFTAEQFKDFIDKPTAYKDTPSGFFLNVSAKAKDGTITQELTRNTSSTNPFKCIRQVSLANDSVAEWRPTTPEMRTLWHGDTRSQTTLTLKESLWNYDLLLFRVWAPNGKSNTTFIRSKLVKDDGRIIFNGNNIGDSEGSITFYPFEMHAMVSEDGMTINQNVKTELVINPPNQTTRRECSVGIYTIIGFNGFNVLPSLA